MATVGVKALVIKCISNEVEQQLKLHSCKRISLTVSLVNTEHKLGNILSEIIKWIMTKEQLYIALSEAAFSSCWQWKTNARELQTITPDIYYIFHCS